MYESDSTNRNNQQSQPHINSPQETGPIVDFPPAEWFCQRVSECATAAVLASGVEDRVLAHVSGYDAPTPELTTH
jgi:hypothetical protein